MLDNPNTLVRKIDRLSYPFLDELSKIDSHAQKIYLTEINEIAKEAYTKPGSDTPTMSFGQLLDTVKRDLTAWLICIEKNKIQGFVHVQLISASQADQLAHSQIDENNLVPISVDSLDDKVIHIGSVVSRNFPAKISSNIPVRLIAGTIDKIIALRECCPSINRIVTCDFEDKHGISHFRNILHKYGFAKFGSTIQGDTVWELNLEKNDRNFSNLITIVNGKRISFLAKKQYLPFLKTIIPSCLDSLKSINQIISELKSLRKELIPAIETINVDK